MRRGGGWHPAANLGLQPQTASDAGGAGHVVTVPVPPPSGEYKARMLKTAATVAETARATGRRVRQDALDKVRQAAQGGSADDAKRLERQVQAAADAYTKAVAAAVDAKAKEREDVVFRVGNAAQVAANASGQQAAQAANAKQRAGAAKWEADDGMDEVDVVLKHYIPGGVLKSKAIPPAQVVRPPRPAGAPLLCPVPDAPVLLRLPSRLRAARA